MGKITALLITVLCLSACGHANSQADVDAQDTHQKTISGLPDAACSYYADGAHAFCGGLVEPVVAYDCGMRSGYRCFYFYHAADGVNPVSHGEAACVLPFQSGEACSI